MIPNPFLVLLFHWLGGLIEVEFTRADGGVRAGVTLPPEITGTLVARGRIFELHPGYQRIEWPVVK